ncbi:uncharacterized protein DS421_11g340680 [Arachis hypogaea]|nr:uncharacterized protein DS421_11g340680 [Arachis hypogaea]
MRRGGGKLVALRAGLHHCRRIAARTARVTEGSSPRCAASAVHAGLEPPPTRPAVATHTRGGERSSRGRRKEGVGVAKPAASSSPERGVHCCDAAATVAVTVFTASLAAAGKVRSERSLRDREIDGTKWVSRAGAVGVSLPPSPSWLVSSSEKTTGVAVCLCLGVLQVAGAHCC